MTSFVHAYIRRENRTLDHWVGMWSLCLLYHQGEEGYGAAVKAVDIPLPHT